MVFHGCLSDSKSPQVSRTLLSILAVLNNVLVWMVSTRPPTSKSSSPFSNPLVTVPKAPITIGIIVTFMFHSFFNSLARSRYSSLFSYSFSFILWSAGTAKSTILQVLFFLLIIIRSSLLAEIRLYVCRSKSHWSLCVLFSRIGTGLFIYHLLVWSNFNFLHFSHGITLPTQSCLVLYSFCANLLHLLMWLMVSSLSPHSLHLLFCCVLSVLVLIWLILMALFCAAIRRDSVSLLRFPFLCYVQFMLYSGWNNEGQHFIIRIYTSFYSFERSWSLCGLWDRRMGVRIQDKLLYWPITSFLFFKTHLALLLLGQGCSTGGLVWATSPSGRALSDCKLWFWSWLPPTHSAGGRPTRGSCPQGATLTDCKLALTLAFTVFNWLNCRGHLHILFHNTHLLPIRSHDLLPLIYTGASLIDGLVKGQYVTFLSCAISL